VTSGEPPGTASAGSPTGVIVVRVWQEPSHSTPFRARITAVRDVDARGPTEGAVASSVDETVALVRQFVEAFAAQ
jgi:hypothetical protein